MPKKSNSRPEAPRPLSPDGLRYLLHDAPHAVGEGRALALLGVNRTTLARWLSGAVKVPHAAALVLRQVAEGIPPGGSDVWRGFRFDGDFLVTASGHRLHANRLEKLEWLDGMRAGQVAALEREIAALRGQVESLRRVGGSANDAVGTPPPRVTSGA